MAFSEDEIADHLNTIERCFWAKRRPPEHVRHLVRDGRRVGTNYIELFFIRPSSRRPGEEIEESIAKVRYVRSRDVWRVYWKRADGKWHEYQSRREAKSLVSALKTIHKDPYGCFFG